MISLIPLILLTVIRISTAAPISSFSEHLPAFKRVIKSVTLPPDTKTFLQRIPFFPIFVYGLLVLFFAGGFLTYIKCRPCSQSTTARRRKRRAPHTYTQREDENSVMLRDRQEKKKRELVSLINSNELEYDEAYELNPDQLEINEVLGDGNVGVVHKGRLGNRDVAIKKALNPQNRVHKKMMEDELIIMCAIGTNPYVIALVGGIIRPIPTIVTEYANCGSLKDFLRGIRTNNKFTDLLNYTETPNRKKTEQYKKGVLSRNMAAISTIDIISFSYQIATGMVYLASIPCVHRDLALRNVFLMSDGTIRIGDFGLTRRHENREYYRIANHNIEIPYKWVAPECFTSEKFDEKSDVWSFGVSLFEMFTLGETPYKNIHDVQLFLERGDRLEEPTYCHLEIYKFMKLCWDVDPECRPDFGDCAMFFKKHMTMIDKNSHQTLESKRTKILEQRREMERMVRELTNSQ